MAPSKGGGWPTSGRGTESRTIGIAGLDSVTWGHIGVISKRALRDSLDFFRVI